MNAPAHTGLLLTKQTFVALVDGTLVFLDLHRDKYLCLERWHTRPIAQQFGLPLPDDGKPAEKAEGPEIEDVGRIIEDMTERGLVTRVPGQGKRAAFITQYRELKELPGYFPGEGPTICFYDAVKFFKALMVTKLLLQFVSMERIVMRVRRRKDRYRAKGETIPDDERLHELVETYKTLKPLFVTTEDQCLFSSLFLIEFLACYRMYPNWYFAVRLNEFYAHCWVQDHNFILDDFIHRTSANQPIMAV